jgi:hypothetical protein
MRLPDRHRTPGLERPGAGYNTSMTIHQGTLEPAQHRDLIEATGASFFTLSERAGSVHALGDRPLVMYDS